jgi:Ca-activated chloride channel family protein
MTMRTATRWAAASVAALGLAAVGGPGLVRGVALARLPADAVSPRASRQQPPAFRAGVDVVVLNVTVTDAAGRYVTDLTPADFAVFEDGATQNVTFFGRATLPLALALLLDTSASMEDKLATAQEAAIGFARHLRPADVAELTEFDRDVRILQGFTNDADALERAIRRTSAGGSTSLYNAIYISLKELKKHRAGPTPDVRREAIVVLSDGQDTSSLVTYDEVLDLAKRSETAIYTIGLRSKDDAGARGFSEADFVLRDLAQQTGGRVFFAARPEELAGIYGRIAEELASQYVLGYVSRNSRRDGGWRRLAVRVDRENTIARTRQGYFGPTGK